MSAAHDASRPPRGAGVERVISRVLFLGGVVSVGIALLGLVLHFVVQAIAARPHEVERLAWRQATGHSPHVFVSVPEIWRALTASPPEPLALTAIGLLLLLVTPIVGVGVAVVGFRRERDRDYTVIAAIVLGMLLVSFLIAGGGGG